MGGEHVLLVLLLAAPCFGGSTLESVEISPHGQVKHHTHSRVHRQQHLARASRTSENRLHQRNGTSFSLVAEPDVEPACETERDSPHDKCPEHCPLAAEISGSFCHFRCVEPEECGGVGLVAEATIPDEEKHECRRCDVEGCKLCKHGDPGEEVELCDECMPGYLRLEGGKECKRISDWIFLGIAVTVGIIIVLVICWYVDLASKPIVNTASIEEGNAHRSRTKVRQEGVPGRPVWPPSTNLCTEDVAGVGTIVFFRFQAAILIWAIFGFVMQLCFGFFVSTDIFKLGMLPARTPQEFCDVIKWGRTRQMELIWAKVTWLAIFYPFSFLGAIFYAINTGRLFAYQDNDHMTMSDYVALVKGIPKLKGDRKLEDELKEVIESQTGQKVVGVSVAWDFSDHHTEHHVIEAVDHDAAHLDDVWRRGSSDHTGPGNDAVEHKKKPEIKDDKEAEWQEAPEARAWQRKGMSAIFDIVSAKVLSKWRAFTDDTEEEHDAHHIKDMLKNIESTQYAFAVFETEVGRDAALEHCEKGGLNFESHKLVMELEENEPQGIVWEHTGISEAALTWNLIKSVFWMAVAVGLWVVILYLPYEMWMTSFSFANGDEPAEAGELIFICLVVGAQVGLFIVANILSHHAGFIYEDHHQCWYIVLYNGALIINLAMDLALTATLSFKQMAGRGVHTADGRLLGDLPNLQQIFESYPMQKAVGLQLKKYCWPATFLLPFACEPILAIWLPWHLGKLFIASHPHLTGRKAERTLTLPVMEQGRFADLIFNAILVACVPFFAPGYMHLLFGYLIFSHLYIYTFDHIRTLRNITRFHFSGNICNMQGQRLFSIPCGLIAAGLVFKWNQWKSDHKVLGSGPLQNEVLWGAMAGAFFGHIALHLFILKYIVPCFCHVVRPPEKRPYKECAALMPATWFSVNPVYCLRSKYIYEHSPPQTYYTIGKEHLMQKNEAIGAYFTEEPAVVEDYSKSSLF